MKLVEKIWQSKSENIVNPVAFSELARNLAKAIDIEGREFLTDEDRKRANQEIRDPRERDEHLRKLAGRREEEYKNLPYETWILEKDGWKDRQNKPTQIRKFYDAIFKLNQRARAGATNWPSIVAQLHRQLALVHYAKGRKLVTDTFVSMMEELIKAVNRPEDLQVITDFLETFMAYYKECRPN